MLSSSYGYTDVIANDLSDAKVLNSFNEDFCESGMTAKDLASATDILNTPDSHAWHLVKNAELATLTIGANDLLPAIKLDLQLIAAAYSSDPSSVPGLLQKMHSDVSTIGASVRANMETILQNILNANKNVKIYVMGYYNPFTLMLSSYSALMTPLNAELNNFNSYIQTAVNNVVSANKDVSITYVDTMGSIARNTSDYLSSVDIHPTIAGYETIADDFWPYIEQDLHALNYK